MHIASVDVIPVRIPLTAPVRMATHTITHAANVLVRMESGDGVVGWGEAAEAHNMTGDLQPGIAAAARQLAQRYRGADARRLRALARAADADMHANTSAKSALDMAAHDLVARTRGVPLHDLLGGAVRSHIAALCIVGSGDPDADAERAAAGRAAGHREFKLKVGMAGVDSDARAALAVREAIGFDAVLGADANQSLTVARAVRFLQRAQDADLAYLEQPLPGTDPRGLAALRAATTVGIGIDEGLHAVRDLLDLAAAGAVDGVALKLIKTGGVGATMLALELAELLGLAVNLSGKIAETSIAAAALTHVAAAAPALAWGFSVTNHLLEADVARTPIAISDGGVDAPTGPGLGIDVDEGAVAEHRVDG
ncbi:MAG TPA: mandelate racemase/muconate lactonizing enzyme family protein [Euzebyales bacterium]|nr:mandelate racemase/muconate lactonizing enzyme family protein [Euzebyales bacterium]